MPSLTVYSIRHKSNKKMEVFRVSKYETRGGQYRYYADGHFTDGSRAGKVIPKEKAMALAWQLKQKTISTKRK